MVFKNVHISPDSAYVVNDYPFGFRLRCKIRYWIEYKPEVGFRLASQTTNPKRGDGWNKPKFTTYSLFGGAMYLDERNYVQFACLNEYTSGVEAKAFRDTFGEGVPEAGRVEMLKWVSAKIAFDAVKAMGESYGACVLAAREAAKSIETLERFKLKRS
jgi:hypothetical protein